MTYDLAARATALGVLTSYQGVDQRWHRPSPRALARVVEVLEADRDPSPGPLPPVVVVPSGRPGAQVAVAPAGRPAPGGRLVAPDGQATGSDGAAADLETEDGAVFPVARHGGSLVLPALPVGVHRLRLRDRAGTTTVVLAPPLVMPRSAGLDGGVTLFTPTYALWSADRPDPSMAHLHTLCRSARRHGVAVVTTLPLLAAYLDDPFDPSPYAPVSRYHWNETYLDPADIPGTAEAAAATEAVGRTGLGATLGPMRASHRPGFTVSDTPTVDAGANRPGDQVPWRGLAAVRRHQLLDAVDHLTPADGAAFEAWLRATPDVTRYARFRADRDPGRPAFARAGGAGRAGPVEARLTRSYELGQWLMERSLHRIAADPLAAGLGLDLPIGCHPKGYETWAHAELYAAGMTIGAPPDAFFTEGQNWGLPPPLPGANRRTGHLLWRQVVERSGRHASLLRVDHVLGAHRLWWIPEGHAATDGVYVRYPAAEILAAIAIAAARAGATVVGENLGTVPPEIDRELVATATLGMYEEQFTMVSGETPGPLPADVVAGIRTHDMPAFAVAAVEPGSVPYAAALGSTSRPVDPADLLDRVLARLGSSSAYLVSVDLDDLVGETRAHNLPGIADPHGWSRRAEGPVSTQLDEPEVARRLRLLMASRPRPSQPPARPHPNPPPSTPPDPATPPPPP